MIRIHDYNFGESSYNHSKMMFVMQDDIEGIKCDSCKNIIKDCPIIGADNSDDEYATIHICERCIYNIIKKYKNIK